jgi:hypothetical protein
VSSRVRQIVSVGLQAVGAFTLIIILALAVVGALTWKSVQSRRAPKTGYVKPEHALFVLQWSGLSERCKVLEVRHSFQSGRGNDGARSDALCLRIDQFPEEVARDEADAGPFWIKPPLKNPILYDSLVLAASQMQANGQRWFPAAEQLNSERFFVGFHSIRVTNRSPVGVQLLACDRQERKIYYADIHK